MSRERPYTEAGHVSQFRQEQNRQKRMYKTFSLGFHDSPALAPRGGTGSNR